jgi:hypothetical protein
MDIGPEMPPSPAFPNLAPGNHRVTSDRATAYNCIAWAAGDDVRWWWPVEAEDVHWPGGVPRVEDLASFAAAFATLGYQPCESDGLEPGWEKVAIYAVGRFPKHAARQLPDGWWTSKLGKSFDIAHTIEAVAGPTYGEPALFLSRLVATEGESTRE